MDNYPSQPVSENIDKVAKLTEAASARRTWSAKVGAAITSGFGTVASIIIHFFLILGWCFYNSGRVPKVHPFDPYPFNLLTFIVSFEGVLIALFVLLTQNRMSRQADLRAHLNLQVGILIEQEVTAVLQLVKSIAEKNEVLEEHEKVQSLLDPTDIEQFVSELEKKVPLE